MHVTQGTAAAVAQWSNGLASTTLQALNGPGATALDFIKGGFVLFVEMIPEEYRLLMSTWLTIVTTTIAEFGQQAWPFFIAALVRIGQVFRAVDQVMAPVFQAVYQQCFAAWVFVSEKVWPRVLTQVIELSKWLQPRLEQLGKDAFAAAASVTKNGPTQAFNFLNKLSTKADAFLVEKLPAVHAKLAVVNAALSPYVHKAKAAAAPHLAKATHNIRVFYAPDGQLSADRVIYTMAVAVLLLTAIAFIRSRTAMQNATKSHDEAMKELLKPPSQQGKAKKTKKSKKSKKGAAPKPAAASSGGGSEAPSSGGGGSSKRGPKKKKINMAEVMKKAKVAQKEADKLPEHESLLRGVKGHAKGNCIMNCFAMSHDQRFLATGGTDSHVRVTVLAGWEEGTVSKTHSWELEYTYPTALAWSPNSHFLLVADAKKQVHVYAVHKDAYKAPELRKTHPVSHKGEMCLLQAGAFQGNAASLFAVTASGDTKDTSFNVLGMGSGEKLASGDTGQVQHYDVTVSPSAEWLSFASWTPEAKLWHVASKGGSVSSVTKAMVLGGHSGGVRGVHFSADSKRVHTVSMDGEVRVWSLDVAWQRGADARKEGAFGVPRAGKVLRTAMRADGSLMAVLMQEGASAAVKAGTSSAWGGGANGRIIFVDPVSGREVPLPGGDMDLTRCFGGAGVQQFCFSPCGRLLLTLGKNAHRLLIWQVPDVDDSDSDWY